MKILITFLNTIQELTEALQKHLTIDRECRYLAVDIDPVLIDRCNSHSTDIDYQVQYVYLIFNTYEITYF